MCHTVQYVFNSIKIIEILLTCKCAFLAKYDKSRVFFLHSLFSLYEPSCVMFINQLWRWCICSDSFLSTQPSAGCSPCLLFSVAWHQVFSSGMTESWHVITLTSSSVNIGCVTVYLIIISCYWTAMTSPSYPLTKKNKYKKHHTLLLVSTSTHSL